jgi:hypothetical protein
MDEKSLSMNGSVLIRDHDGHNELSYDIRGSIKPPKAFGTPDPPPR